MPRRRRPSRLNRRVRRNPHEIPFIRGHKIAVPNHPTEFCSQPWFPLIVRVLNPSAGITLGELYNSLVQQLTGISFQQSSLNVRLHSVRIWGPIPTTNTALRAVFKDVFDDVVQSSVLGAQNHLEVVENFADQVNRARVGYVYSTAQQQKSLFVAASQNDQICALSGAGTGSVAYVQLLWRPFVPSTGFTNRLSDLANEVNERLTVLRFD